MATRRPAAIRSSPNPKDERALKNWLDAVGDQLRHSDSSLTDLIARVARLERRPTGGTTTPTTPTEPTAVPRTIELGADAELGDVLIAGSSGAEPATSIDQAALVLGISKASAVAGQTVAYAGSGDTVTNASWNWAIGPVFLSSSGALVQTRPTVAKLVGVAISDTTILVVVGDENSVEGGEDYPDFVPRTRLDGVLDETVAVPHALNTVATGKTVLIPENHDLIVADDLLVEGFVVIEGRTIEL